MKDKMKGLIVGLTIGSLLSGTAALAASSQIEVAFRNLTYMFDGVQKEPTGNKGFIYEGTTYVPIRFVSEALGKPVEWDEANETIWIGTYPKRVVASYDGGTVTQGELDTFLAVQRFFSPGYAGNESNAEYLDFMLRQLLRERLLSAEASASDQALAAAEANVQIAQWKRQYASGELESLLSGAGLTEQELLQFLIRNMSANKAISSSIPENEIKAKYDKQLTADPSLYTIASVRHILIGFNDAAGSPLRSKEEALSRAKEVQQKLNAGGDFAQLAKEYSDDPGSKDNGGLYEDTKVEVWVPEFKQAAMELNIGAISEPIASAYGYHVMKVESRKVQSYAEVKNDLHQQLAAERDKAFMETELPKRIEKIDLGQ